MYFINKLKIYKIQIFTARNKPSFYILTLYFATLLKTNLLVLVLFWVDSLGFSYCVRHVPVGNKGTFTFLENS